MCSLRLWLAPFVTLVLLPLSVPAQEPAPSKSSDLAEYMQTVEKLKNEPVEKQVEILRDFLDSHPESPFRPEAESNLKRLEDLLNQTDPVKRKEARDTQRYLRAVEYAKKLSPRDQIALWEQFLEENPKSLYYPDAATRLEELKARYGKTPAEAPQAPSGGAALPVVKERPSKDRQTAFLLAAFPGLIVPGIGHWYAHDYVTGGILTGVRVAGIGLLIPGIVSENMVLMILGGIVYAFSYGVDVVRAPYAVDHYNDALEANERSPTSMLDLPGVPRSRLAFSLSFPF